MRTVLTGGGGMLGSSIRDNWKRLHPNDELVVLNREIIDLRDKEAVLALLSEIQADCIIHAAAKVSGIAAKIARPTSFLLDNLSLDTAVIGSAIELGIPRLLYVGSAVVYPEKYERPFGEEDMLEGGLESANEGYGIAKISGIKLCEFASKEFGFAYRSVIPSNMYGPHDHFDSPDSHLIPATLRKVHGAKIQNEPEVVVWGDGLARREFTYADDIASWLLTQVGMLERWPPRLNLGCGEDHSVLDYYEAAQKIVGYQGSFIFDLTKPSGTPRRLLDSSAAGALGWKPKTSLLDGMAASYEAMLSRQQQDDRSGDIFWKS